MNSMDKRKSAMAVFIALIMVASTFFVAVPLAQAANDKWTSELYAWDPVQNAWVNGNLAGYREGDLVGFKYVLTHDSGTNNLSPEIDSVYDHYNIAKHAFGIDAEILWAYNRVGWSTQFPVHSDDADLNTPDLVRNIDPDVSNAFFGISGGVVQKYYKFNAGRFEVPTGTSIYIYFQAHLAETAYYSTVTTPEPITGTPAPHYGAAYFPGASLQAALSLVYTGTTAQTQSIPVTYAAGSISGMKFHDANSNGIRDPGEGGLSNWTIILEGVSAGGFPIVMQTTTATDGTYSFNQLPWGTYSVREVLKPGWTQTYPTSNGGVHVGIVIDGTDLTEQNVNFGNSAPGKIRAAKVIDRDGDESTEEDQMPGEGWTFELFYYDAGTWRSLGSKVTGADGYTAWWSLLPLGNYKMVETGKAGYAGVQEKFISITTAHQEITMTFYNRPLGSITVTKVIDQDGDPETMEDQSNGGAGWEFELLYYNGQTWVSQGKKTTDGTGTVTWNDLPLGRYKVVETPRDYWHNADPVEITLTEAGVNVPVTMINTPPTPAIKIVKTGPVEAEVGEIITYTYTVTNVGEAPLSNVYVMDSVSGATTYISGDVNLNGMLDLTEVWIFEDTWTVAASPDPLINIATAYGTWEGVQVMDQDEWSLDVAKPAIHIEKYGPTEAEVGDLIKFTFVVTNVGDVPLANVTVVDSIAGAAIYVSGDVNNNHMLDLTEMWTFELYWTVQSAPDPLYNVGTATGYYEDTPVTDEDDHTTVVIQPGMIIVYKYDDLNGNGVHDIGEPGVQGVTIELWLNGELKETKTTNATGEAVFDKLRMGTYVVKEIMPAGWYSDAPLTQEVVIDRSGEQVDVTFLNIRYGQICVYKYDDLNGNGIRDAGEPAVPGVTIELWFGEQLVGSGTTDSNGMVCFSNLKLGTYHVKEILPTGWYSDAPLTQEVVIDESGERVDVTFLNIRYVTLCIYKFADMDGDLETTTDREPVNVWVKVIGPGDAIIFEGYIGDDGYLCIENLKVGEYTVTETLECYWIPLTETTITQNGQSGDRLVFTFINMEMVPYPGGHTIGFWKNNILKNMQGRTKGIQVPYADIARYLSEIDEMYGDEYEFLNDLSFQEAYNILSIPNPSDPQDKAEAQILSMILTSRLWAPEWGDSFVHLPDVGQGSTYTGSGSGAIDYILGLYSDGAYSKAQYLADGMNNAPEGVDWYDWWYVGLDVYVFKDYLYGSPVEGVTLTLTGPDGTMISQTDELGYARFEWLIPGTYFLEITVPVGMDPVGATTFTFTVNQAWGLGDDIVKSFVVTDEP
ncbi:MAG: DUF11 domain-containing protein [Methanomassiliicoccales archaeon]|nr:MAG: DUF11 domain-containing protein [Methanomassiliicoccales archaeon]